MNEWVSCHFESLCTRIVNGGTPETNNYAYWNGETPWITGADFTTHGIGEIRRYVSENGIRNSATSVVKAGNLLVVTRTGVGKLAVTPCDIAISQDITGVYVNELRADVIFVFYLLKYEIEELKKRNQGTSINGIIRSDLEKHKIRIPEKLSIQRKIAAILTTVDTAIEKTEALIEKYQQIKAGLMHDLFTRGVLPNGKLRPPREQAPELYQETAVGWIPKEWNVQSLNQLSEIVSGVTLGGKLRPDENLEVPYLRVANVQDGYLDLSSVKTIMISRKTLESLRLKQGDILMNEGGDFDKLGRGTVWENEIEDCIHQNHVFRVRVNFNKILPYFLAYFSESTFGKKYFLISSKQSTNLASINSKQLHGYPIALPNINEQKIITDKLQASINFINKLNVDKNKLQMQKLGLMQDLLTGKVEVRI